MESPFAPRDHGVSLPSIYIDEGSRPRSFGSSSRTSNFSPAFQPGLASIPMSIPQSSSQDVPPPLPPPRYFHIDGPVGNATEKYRRRDYEAAVAAEELPHYKTRIDRDEGYHSLDSPRQQSNPYGSGRFGVHHDQFQFKSSADDAYDNSLLKKLDSRRTLDNRSPPRRPGLSSSEPPRPLADRFHALPTLSLPTRIRQQQSPLLVSPSRYTETPLRSTVSPRSTPFSHYDYRQSHEQADLEQSPIARTRRTNSGSLPDDVTVSTQGSYDMMAAEDADFPMEETSRLRDFHIDGALARPVEYQTVGQKRRASSPPGDEPPPYGMTSTSDLLRRREGVSRASPTPRLSVVGQGSISSVSSAGRSNSYQSNLSLAASSMTSMNSFGPVPGQRSPRGMSPGGMSPTDSNTTACNSPYATPISLTTSPRSAAARTPHHRTLSEHSKALASPRKLTEIKPNISKLQGFFICDCCPKKPKKFETALELSAHEAEKQYECHYCGNRFKNKNEAERHQNSLHVRPHSWSCSALSGYDRAFHESTSRPGEADACGYCGEEFMRGGRAPGRTSLRHITEQDWEERIRHLQDVHKFRECNASKKFFRADHFRQHLKHSHAGTSGKWTNMLENACMLEEEPPVMPAR